LSCASVAPAVTFTLTLTFTVPAPSASCSLATLALFFCTSSCNLTLRLELGVRLHCLWKVKELTKVFDTLVGEVPVVPLPLLKKGDGRGKKGHQEGGVKHSQ
jgi:hypothetical protein